MTAQPDLVGLFDGDGSTSSEEVEDALLVVESVGDWEFTLSLAPDDGSSPGTLFAYTIWSGSRQLAALLHAEPELVAGRRVVELGAACALPSLVALACGAASVVVTDFPHVNILSPIEANLTRNAARLGQDPETRAHVVGHLWGSNVDPVLRAGADPGAADPAAAGRFDVLLLAECLWMHEEHERLLQSIDALLRPDGTVLLSFAHHVPGHEANDLRFFTLAAERHGFETEHLRTDEMKHMWSDERSTTQFLQRLAKPTGRNASPDQGGAGSAAPPSPGGAAASPSPGPRRLCGRVSGDVADLEALRGQGFTWLPGVDTIRPSSETLARKVAHSERVQAFYESELDFVLEQVFELPTEFPPNGGRLRVVNGSPTGPRRKCFRRNDFPYATTPETLHYIMWYLGADRGSLADGDITRDIADCIHLADREEKRMTLDFAWYLNPKMSVPGVFHVQVFRLLDAPASRPTATGSCGEKSVF